MPHIQPPPSPTHTFVFWLGWKWYFTADSYDLKANEIKDVWLLGKYLESFFRYIATILREAAQLLFNGDTLIVSLQQWVEGITEGNTFVELLDWVSGQYRSIRIDPVRWVFDSFRDISLDMLKLVETPTLFVNEKVRNLTGWYSLFLDNPILWVIEQLKGISWAIADFIQDPVETILRWVINRYSYLEDIKLNPVNWIVNTLGYWQGWIVDFFYNPANYIQGALIGLGGTVGELITNPATFVTGRIASTLGISEGELYNLWETAFNHILDGLEEYTRRRIGQVEQVICDIILLFI